MALAALASERSPDAVLDAAAALLAGAGRAAAVVELATRSLRSDDPEKQARGAVLAGRVAAPGAAAEILALAARRPDLGCAALARLAAAGDRRAGAALIARLADRSAGARVAAARAAALASPSPSLARALAAHLGDRDERVRAAAIRATAALAPARLAISRGESSPLVLIDLAESLGRVAGRAATRQLETLARHDDAAVRAAAATALRDRPGNAAAGRRLLADAETRVRAAALWAATDAALLEMTAATSPLRVAATVERPGRGPDARWAARQLALASVRESVEYASAWLARDSRAKLKP